ncbi:glycosyltransferase [Kaistella pullorum]|uniref:Glycosyltransferase n=1 Tax=Kaistella pullorum TaxID=2763074 RepID=A0ABR8WIZ3_9FLAO|nr:glycosyltransferase [Kaistella pullorum]MBD8017026.1 glycosyltransferase [Kaistella pullorum]
MKVLLFTVRYEPFESIGSNRTIALVRYLKSRGIDYKVITAYAGKHSNENFTEDNNIKYYSYLNLSNLQTITNNFYSKRENSKTLVVSERFKPFRIFRKFLRSVLQSISYPDPYWLWAYRVIKSAEDDIRAFAPDIIISSSYPYSSHFPAYHFSKRLKIKWYAELRDPWVNNHVQKRNFFISFLDRNLSKFIFRKAEKLITVTETWQRDFEKLYNKEVALVRNGFQLANLTGPVDSDIQRLIENEKRKIILYTGLVFKGNQKIEEFLLHFSKDRDLSSKFIFLYVGGSANEIRSIINHHGLNNENLFVLNKVSHSTALWLQRKANFLLLLNWHGQSGGIIPGKFYEYLGVNKPILLWNGGLKNELFHICESLNNKSSKLDKVLILNGDENVNLYLEQFRFNDDLSIVLEYSRDFQFKKLIDEVLK